MRYSELLQNHALQLQLILQQQYSIVHKFPAKTNKSRADFQQKSFFKINTATKQKSEKNLTYNETINKLFIVFKFKLSIIKKKAGSDNDKL